MARFCVRDGLAVRRPRSLHFRRGFGGERHCPLRYRRPAPRRSDDGGTRAQGGDSERACADPQPHSFGRWLSTSLATANADSATSHCELIASSARGPSRDNARRQRRAARAHGPGVGRLICRTACRVSSAPSRSNASDPVSISCSTTPRLKRSERASTSRPSICSGDMYSMVPTMSPGCVSVLSERSDALTDASPKSSSFTPPAVTMTFCGFKSRWTIPSACAQASASAISAA